MARMKIFTVHIRADAKTPYENPIFIKEGFNLWAFIFVWGWALYRKLWLVAGLLLLVEVILRLLAHNGLISGLTGTLLGLCVQVLLAFHANDLHRAQLRRKGYITSDIVTSDNEIGAEQRFFERYFPQAHSHLTHRHLPG